MEDKKTVYIFCNFDSTAHCIYEVYSPRKADEDRQRQTEQYKIKQNKSNKRVSNIMQIKFQQASY